MKVTTRFIAAISALGSFVLAHPAQPCTPGKSVGPEELVDRAAVIVHVTAINYAGTPEERATTSARKIRFVVNSVLVGKDVPEILELTGYLSDEDDWNDGDPPYRMVRPGGRDGSCHARLYKQGGEFLLFLARRGDWFRTLYAGMAPVNEQVRGPGDPWIVWVREQLESSGRISVP